MHDPFNGGGTTGVAAKIIGNRKYFGIDIEEEYIHLTKGRLNKIIQKPRPTDNDATLEKSEIETKNAEYL